ncbi:MAG: ShlB/FhaC/HecB family hemolysin secretion/activation protein [Caulobacteraceae bacterium]
MKRRLRQSSSISVAALLVTAMTIGGVGASEARAQAIERNLPALNKAAPMPSPAEGSTPQDNDARPLGASLKSIIVLGPSESLRPTITTTLDLSHAPGLENKMARRRLEGFIGQPLTRKLIAQIEAQIVRDYRRRGLPLISVSTPEQEISGGVLQIRVIPFRLGRKTAPGAASAAYVVSRTRSTPGELINARLLNQDLDWLNRYPFRTSQAVFSPGDGVGLTNLILKSSQAQPWTISAGYSNSGSPLTGFDRYFAGATAALPFLHDAYASYQFTGSNDVLFSQDRPFDTAPSPRYLSHSGRLVIPTLPRQDVELTVSYVESNEITDFVAHQVTEEASLAYRSALSNISVVLPGEAVLGVEARRESGRTVFDGEPVQNGESDVFQVYVGFADQESDPLGRTSGDLTVHISPGGVDDRNTDAAFAAASQGRSTSAEYAYISGDISRYTALPGRFGYSVSLTGQYAPNPLPLTEQIGLGGASQVRGYTLDDGVFDSGVLARNELRAPGFPVLGRLGSAFTDQISPFGFVDAGYGKNAYTRMDSSPVSAGLGADYQLSRHLTANLAAAWALKSEGYTKAGGFRLESRVATTF